MAQDPQTSARPHMLPRLARTLVAVSFLLVGAAVYKNVQAAIIVPGQIKIIEVTLLPDTLMISSVGGITSNGAFQLRLKYRNLNSTFALQITGVEFTIIEFDDSGDDTDLEFGRPVGVPIPPFDPLEGQKDSSTPFEFTLFNPISLSPLEPGVNLTSTIFTPKAETITVRASDLNFFACQPAGRCDVPAGRASEDDALGSGLEFAAVGKVSYAFFQPLNAFFEESSSLLEAQRRQFQLGFVGPEASVAFDTRQVPEPSTLILFGTGLLGLGLLASRRRKAA